MLTFMPLLCIAVSVRDLGGAPDQLLSPKECREFEVNMRSTRRLNIFESITQTENEQNGDFPVSIGYEEGCSVSDDDKTVNELLQHSLVKLTEIIRKLELNDLSKAMRVPVSLVPVQSSLMVFQSLLRMLSNPQESRSPTSWQQYLIKSISNEQCSVLDLCKEL